MTSEFDGADEWLHDGEDDDEGEKEKMVINPTSVRERIDEKLDILSDFKTKKQPNVSRADVMAALSNDLCEYYGYIPDLANLFLDLFSPAECVEFMDASDRPRPLVIRTNTLKITRKDVMDALGKRGVNLEAIDWSKVAVKVIDSTVPIGATPEYLAGYYMLQAASSLCPVVALDPLPGEKVLDMSAAPGGKTTYIAQLMKNSGSVIANDLKPQRQKATVANLHRMGVKNAIVCCYDGRKISQTFKGFDRVLLDAPCSGLGVIARDQTVKLQRTYKDIQRIAHLQKELLCSAVDAVDPKSTTGGIIVYSTCSVSVEENEQVIQYILNKRHVRLIPTGLEIGRPGYTRHKERRFHPSLELTRRFYPHVHNMDGFFVAKLKKYANGPKAAEDADEEFDAAGEEGEERVGSSEEDSTEDDSDIEVTESPVKNGKKNVVSGGNRDVPPKQGKLNGKVSTETPPPVEQMVVAKKSKRDISSASADEKNVGKSDKKTESEPDRKKQKKNDGGEMISSSKPAPSNAPVNEVVKSAAAKKIGNKQALPELVAKAEEEAPSSEEEVAHVHNVSCQHHHHAAPRKRLTIRELRARAAASKK